MNLLVVYLVGQLLLFDLKELADAVPIRHIGLPTKGKYTVREETEKAPSYDHHCNLTRTAVKISFPDEMRSEIFVNLLGYKEPNLVHLMRCKGLCGHGESALACRPTRIREKKVRMMIRSVLTGKEPVDREKELILDEHVECGCECSEKMARECSGYFNKMTCECECPTSKFGEKKAYCELRKDSFWDPKNCQCQSRTVASRGLPDYSRSDCEHIELLEMLDSSDSRALDMLAWIVVGASFTLVIALSIATYHYRKKVHMMLSKSVEQTEKNPKFSFDRRTSSSSSRSIYSDRKQETTDGGHYRMPSRFQREGKLKFSPVLTCPDLDMLDNDERSKIEQYNEHGVQIENNCFN